VKRFLRHPLILPIAVLAVIVGAVYGLHFKSRTPRCDRIILIVADALRADHVGCYGAPGNPTPNIDALAARGWRFTDALAPGSETVTSNRALFTGLHPYRAAGIGRQGAVRPGVVTIASHLRQAGFHTVGFSAQPIISPQFGFAQGFESFTCLPSDDDPVTDSAVNWIAHHRRDRYFALVYLLSPHHPYDLASISQGERHTLESEPSPSVTVTFFRQGSKDVIAPIEDPKKLPLRLYFWPGAKPGCAKLGLLHALYKAAVRNADARLGRIMDAIGDDDRALVIFLADHGEEWQDHGHVLHGYSLFREVLRVPFIVRTPGARERSIATPVTHLDVAPTVFDLAGVSCPRDLDGCSLVRPDAIPTRTLFAENYQVFNAFCPPKFTLRTVHECAAYRPGEAIFCCPEYGHAGDAHPAGFKWLRYDLTADPAQQHPLSLLASNPRCKELREYHVKSHSGMVAACVRPAVKLPPDLRAHLRALGYIAK